MTEHWLMTDRHSVMASAIIITIPRQFLWCCRGGQSCFESSLDECARWPPTLRQSQSTWAVCLPVGCCHPHPPLPFVIITQPKSRYSFCCPTEVGRLSSILSRVKFGRNLTPLQFVCKKGEHRINITDYLFVCDRVHVHEKKNHTFMAMWQVQASVTRLLSSCRIITVRKIYIAQTICSH